MIKLLRKEGETIVMESATANMSLVESLASEVHHQSFVIILTAKRMRRKMLV